jgi:hypothetical protein
MAAKLFAPFLFFPAKRKNKTNSRVNVRVFVRGMEGQILL